VPGLKIYAKDIEKFEGNKIEFFGWLHTKRILGNISFFVLRDKTGYIQATIKKEIFGDNYEKIINIREESVIRVYGKVQKKPKGGYEILAEEIEVLNQAEPLPIEIWNPEIKTKFINRIQYRFLDLRRPEIINIFKIRSSVVNYFREFLINNDFIELHTPKIVEMGAESGADVFEIKYYNKIAYLAQSPQLYKQMLMASGIDKYFEISPYWRAEKSHTTRHLSEFWSLDIEVAWIKDHYDIINIAEELIKYTIKKVKKENKEELEILNIDIKVPKDMPKITLLEAYKILESYGKKLDMYSDLDTEAEKILGEYFLKEYDEPIVFVINYPWKERPFYHMRLEEDLNWTKSFDALYNGIEILTGAQREHRYEILVKQIKEKGISIEPLKYYLEAFRYGMPPHGGFGLGIDRFVKQLLNIKDIREVVLWFRDPEHTTP